MNCCEMCMVGIFKHLIHIFAISIVVSFFAMIYIVKDDETDNLGLD